MKKMIRFFLIATLIIASGFGALAQNKDNAKRISREQLAQKQAQYISNQLALEDNVSKKFIAAYCDYQKEVWALGPRIDKKHDTLEEDSQAQMQVRFERSQQILNLRQKYYNEFSKFLTIKQLERVYQIEKQIMNRIDRQTKGVHKKSYRN